MNDINSKKTKLHDWHIHNNAKIVNFSGYAMPLYYSSIIDEHNAVREKVGLFDISHMGSVIVSGNGSKQFLQKVTTNDIESLSAGKAQYSAMCNENGNLIDDFIVYDRECDYLLVFNSINTEKNIRWLFKHNIEDVKIKNQTDKVSILSIQGPSSIDVLRNNLSIDIDELSFYHFQDAQLNGINCMVSRTGYTGELGYEIFSNIKNVIALWEEILNLGKDHGIKPVGLGCRDTLRMEMNYALYGNEINENINPFEAGLGWITSMKKNKFIGRSSLLNLKKKIRKKLVCLVLDEKSIPRSGYQIKKDGKKVGKITSGTMSPSLKKGIGIGFIDINHAKIGNLVKVKVRGNEKNATIINPPFYKEGSLHH